MAQCKQKRKKRGEDCCVNILVHIIDKKGTERKEGILAEKKSLICFMFHYSTLSLPLFYFLIDA